MKTNKKSSGVLDPALDRLIERTIKNSGTFPNLDIDEHSYILSELTKEHFKNFIREK